jgi:hypothetical protein
VIAPTTVRILGGWRATIFAFVALVGIAATTVQTFRLHYAEGRIAKWAQQVGRDAVKASESARAQEQAQAVAVANVGEAYEKGKRDAEAAGKRTAADLRAGNLKLRELWQGCEARGVSGAAATSGEPDASADDRADSAGRIVRAADEADAQVRALQDFIRAERK